MSGDINRQELAKLAKSRKDKVTSQVIVEDNMRHTIKLAEFVIEKNYTRYTVAERPSGEMEEGMYTASVSAEADNDINSLVSTFNVGNVLLSDNDVGLETTEFNIWEGSDDDIFGYSETVENESDEEEDPNSELSPNLDNEVVVINDARLDNDNIKVTHFGNYSDDYLISSNTGVLLYDEYTTAIDDFKLLKIQAGREQVLHEIDEQIYMLAAYHAGRDIRCVNSANDIVFTNKMAVRKSEFINREGDTLTELYDINNNLLQQVYTTATSGRDLKITVNYKVKGKLFGSTSGAYRFGVQKYPIDYTETVLEVKALNSKASKEKQNFKIKSDRRCLHLPNVQYFKDRMNLSYVDNSNYTVIDDEFELRRICDYLLSEEMKDNVNCFDAETEGLRFHRWIPPDTKHRLVTYSLSWEDKQSIIVPVRMRYCKNIRPETAAEMLKPVLERTRILAHNGAADTRFVLEEGIDLNLAEDTMQLIKHIIPFINHIEVVGFGKALDDLVKRAFGVDMIDLMKYVFKPSGVDFDFALLNRAYMIYYGCPDTDWCRQLWKGLRPKLAPEQELAYRYTVEFSKQMAIHGTYSGLGVNEEHIKQERDRAQSVVNILEQVIYAVTGESRKTLSLTSSVQKSTYIFGRMGADKNEARRTKEGRLSADKVVMEKLGRIKAEVPQDIFKGDITDETGAIVLTAEELNASKYPFCKLIRKHGDLDKNITAFYNGILNNSVNGVYYPDYRIGATDTWRTTDRIQITKKNIKNQLGDLQNEQAGYDKWAWSSTDYAAEEFRLAANGSEDWTLIDMLTEYEADPHTMVASELHGIPPYKVTSKLRGETKAANFGIIYGMKPKALATSIYKRDDPDEGQIAIATDLYNLYCYKRALMLQPLEQAKEFVRENGWLENKLGYRMVYYQILDVKDYITQSFTFDGIDSDRTPIPRIDLALKRRYLGELLNACGNFPIQSWAGGVLMEVNGKLNREFEKKKMKENIMLPLSVHDEIGGTFLIDEVHAYEYIKILNECMVSRLEYLHKPKVAPLYIGVGFGKSWGEAKGDELELPVHLQMMIMDEWANGTAPTIEELKAEGIKEHFIRRIHEYMRGRVRELFKDMIESKHFNRQEMQHRLNLNMFVGKKVHELFKTNDTATMEIILEKYLETVIFYPRTLEEISADGYTWEEGEPIIEEWEKVAQPDEIQDFFFLPQIHPRVVVDKTTVSVDLRGVYHPIVINAVQYIKCLCEPVTFHSKTVIIVTSSGNIFLEEKLLGMPANFSEVFDKILSGATIEIQRMDINRRAPSIVIKENPVLYQGEDGKYKIIVDAFVCNKIHHELFNAVAKILNAFVSKSVLATIPVIIRGENEIDTGLRLVSINVKMQESINDVVNYFLSLSEYAKENTYDMVATEISNPETRKSNDGWVSAETVI